MVRIWGISCVPSISVLSHLCMSASSSLTRKGWGIFAFWVRFVTSILLCLGAIHSLRGHVCFSGNTIWPFCFMFVYFFSMTVENIYCMTLLPWISRLMYFWGTEPKTCDYSIVRLRFTFTPNGKREFVPRDQVFPSIVVYCLLLLHKNKKFHASFIRRIVLDSFICLFSILRNSQLESDVCRKRESLSL